MAQLEYSRPAIALNRFGLGARPGDQAPDRPMAWVLDQLERYETLPAEANVHAEGNRLVAESRVRLAEVGAEMPDAKRSAIVEAKRAVRRDFGEEAYAAYRDAVDARVRTALVTETPFLERIVHFWSNHFCISADDGVLSALALPYENEAIRPHVMGRFEDMLFAVARHPAMLIYLNQDRSIGPNSLAAKRARNRDEDRDRGLNENLAREIMELHTLGVRSGYSQADVTEFAKALTGWTAGGLDARGKGGARLAFAFRDGQHEPGDRRIMGKTYRAAGEEQAAAILSDFAAHPATARFVATKLARHFAGDEPPPALVERLEAKFLESGGRLPALYRVLAESEECWAPQPLKFKPPWEWTLSAMRALDREKIEGIAFAQVFDELGQAVWRPKSPAGWSDQAAQWIGADALMRRIGVAQRLADSQPDKGDTVALAGQLLPASLKPETTLQLERAESLASSLALLLVSPEFMRR
ncbi:DUF1800 domain-containing protein [Qipengyuania sp. 6B39]|uniref:DUF1800 domain-containing protein n=1 Tax=Qipengyuania proteolytica TaxID=2867239 RepID=UPI001C8AEAEA|nr:DUF1800 domain-containing protein [Qipengyuania proteolytica]MBX7494405.1 DUF1800 domain-containing protein [Qipengyuania proteolytica]